MKYQVYFFFVKRPTRDGWDENGKLAQTYQGEVGRNLS